MKKSLFCSLTIFLLLSLAGCKQNQVQSQPKSQEEISTSQPTTAKNSPKEAVSEFLSDLQQENYSAAKKNYTETLDNMAHFRNQIESISPSIANAFFSKLPDFTFEVENTTFDESNPSKATVYLTMNYYDIGNIFESTLLDYIRNEFLMTYDGKKDDDIMSKADEMILSDIDSCSQTTVTHVPVSVILENGTWKVDKMSTNSELVNVLSGNILNTINSRSLSLQENN